MSVRATNLSGRRQGRRAIECASSSSFRWSSYHKKCENECKRWACPRFGWFHTQPLTRRSAPTSPEGRGGDLLLPSGEVGAERRVRGWVWNQPKRGRV